MTHCTAVEWIDVNESTNAVLHQIKESTHSKFIVGDGSLDNVLGVVTIKEFLEHYTQHDFNMQHIIQPPIFIVQNTPAFKILNLFKQHKQYIGVVIDEFGATKGIVTLHDLTEAIVGDLPDEDETDEPSIIKRNDNSYLLDGRTLIFELNQYFQNEIIENNISQYTTISGFILDKVKAMPKVGYKIMHNGYEYEIIDMDNNRIDKVLMTSQE
jgi:putative hemolysin